MSIIELPGGFGAEISDDGLAADIINADGDFVGRFQPVADEEAVGIPGADNLIQSCLTGFCGAFVALGLTGEWTPPEGIHITRAESEASRIERLKAELTDALVEAEVLKSKADFLIEKAEDDARIIKALKSELLDARGGRDE